MTIDKELLTFLEDNIEKGEFSQTEIAQFCGVSRSTISLNLTNGTATKAMCAKLLDFSINYKKEVAKIRKVTSTLNS